MRLHLPASIVLLGLSGQAQNFLQPLPCSQESLLESLNDNTPTSINFVNATSETVDVYWLNFSGQRTLYYTLQPGMSANQGTWVTHPWVVTDPNNVCLSIYEGNANPGTARIAIVGLVLTETGLTFQAVQGGPSPPPGAFSVIAGSGGNVTLTASVSTTSGGSWLSVTPATATTGPSQTPPLIHVTTNPTGLAPGDYYGQVRIDAPGAANTPLSVSVVLNVAPASSSPVPVASPTGLVFTAPANGANPSAQSVTLSNAGSGPLAFQVTASAVQGLTWLTATPASGTLNLGQPVELNVQANPIGLAPGAYQGTVTVQFPQSPVQIAVALIVTSPPSSSSSSLRQDAAAASSCQPTLLDPVFTSLTVNFKSPVAWPVPIEVLVVDDCGQPLKIGSVVANFSNGDPPLSLVSQQNGNWSVTWAPANAVSSSTVVTAMASEAAPKLQGSVSIGGTVAANANTPQLALNGAVSAASLAKNASPAPGELISIFGANMADGAEAAPSLPLATQLQNASIAMAGEVMPLLYASGGQLNAVVPYDTAVGTIQQMVLRRGNRISLPQPVTIGPAEPAVFSMDGSGTGQGYIYGFPTATLQILAAPASPAQAGEVIVLYCGGLGPVLPTLQAGTATPSDQYYNTASPVTLSIGGASANVVFAGLTPGFAGLYQVNATVPSGVAGNQLPVILTVNGVPSPPVTMAVQ